LRVIDHLSYPPLIRIGPAAAAVLTLVSVRWLDLLYHGLTLIVNMFLSLSAIVLPWNLFPRLGVLNSR
jgi:hypothetical protein